MLQKLKQNNKKSHRVKTAKKKFNTFKYVQKRENAKFRAVWWVGGGVLSAKSNFPKVLPCVPCGVTLAVT